MRGVEGIAAVRPGRSSDSTWSEGSKNYIRNVEAVGSNPITSTKSPGHRTEGGSPRKDTLPSFWSVSLRALMAECGSPLDGGRDGKRRRRRGIQGAGAITQLPSGR